MLSKKREDRIEMIEKLFCLAKDGSNENESKFALEKAKELMVKYKISMDEIKQGRSVKPRFPKRANVDTTVSTYRVVFYESCTGGDFYHGTTTGSSTWGYYVGSVFYNPTR